MMPVKRLAVGGLMVVAVAALLAFFPSRSTANDPRLAECGVGTDTPVKAAFDIASALNLSAHFPNKKPTFLVPKDGPAFVVVFDGPVTVPHMVPAPAPDVGASIESDVYNNVVCVVIGETPTLYADVDTTSVVP